MSKDKNIQKPIEAKPGLMPLAGACFLSAEDKGQFQNILNDYLASYQPQQRDELDLLTEAVYAKWRQQRIWVAETATLEITIAQNERDLLKTIPNADAAAHLAGAVAKSADLIQLYLRYNAQIHRQYLRCLKELRELQASRANEEPPPAEQEPCPEDASPSPQTATPNKPNEPETPVQPNEAKPPAIHVLPHPKVEDQNKK